MRGVLTLLVLLAFTGVAHATEYDPAFRADEPPTPVAVEVTPVAPEITPILELRQPVREAATDFEAAATTQPPRNWFWTVAAIVVAGVILAVIL